MFDVADDEMETSAILTTSAGDVSVLPMNQVRDGDAYTFVEKSGECDTLCMHIQTDEVASEFVGVGFAKGSDGRVSSIPVGVFKCRKY